MRKVSKMKAAMAVTTAVTLFGAGAVVAQRQGGTAGRSAMPPGQECPPGQTEIRAGQCQAPSLPPPSIVDYRPKPMLVVGEHKVPRAKFPVIDFHGHPQGLVNSADGLTTMTTAMDSLNVRLMVAADTLSGARLTRAVDVAKGSPHKERIRFLAGVDFSNVGPGWAQKAIAQLEADIKAGAVGVGEISKALGLTIKKPDGTRLTIDDAELDPFWDACGRLNIPVFIHTADPQAFFLPIDNHNERWLELALYPNRRYPSDQFPSFEELAAQRDRMFKKHPNTRFVMAHMGWIASDLGKLSGLLDAMPNVVTELGAILYDLGRQPRAAREFFVKYQDRLLFGKDVFEPSEYPYYWRVFETNDEYFDYYRDYHAFWKLYGIGLPDDVLKKVYYKNALRVTPGLPQTGWPQ